MVALREDAWEAPAADDLSDEELAPLIDAWEESVVALIQARGDVAIWGPHVIDEAGEPSWWVTLSRVEAMGESPVLRSERVASYAAMYWRARALNEALAAEQHNTSPLWDVARCQSQPHCHCLDHGGDVWERCCWCGETRYVPGSGHAQGAWEREVV